MSAVERLDGGDDGGDEADVVEAERAVGRERGGGRGRDELGEDLLHLLGDEADLRALPWLGSIQLKVTGLSCVDERER